MHIVSKFQFFIHIFAMVKLKKTSPKFERGEKTGKNGVFLQLFQSAVSPWIIELILGKPVFSSSVPFTIRFIQAH